MSTEKKKEQQLLEELSAQPAARSSYSTAGLSSRREVENALAKAEYSPSQSVTDAAADLKNWQAEPSGPVRERLSGPDRRPHRSAAGAGQLPVQLCTGPALPPVCPTVHPERPQCQRRCRRTGSGPDRRLRFKLCGQRGAAGVSAADGCPERRFAFPLPAGAGYLQQRGRRCRDPHRPAQCAGTERTGADNAELSDYYSQLDRKGSAYNAAYEQDYGRYQDYLGRLDTLYGYYSAQEQQARETEQAFSNALSVLGVIGDAVQLAITGTTGIGSLVGSLANTGYNMYAKDRAYEAERADAAWSQQMQENQRQDSLAQQKYKNELAERQYQDTLRQQELNNNVTSEKLNIAKGEWALKQSKAAQSAQQAAANAGAKSAGVRAGSRC